MRILLFHLDANAVNARQCDPNLNELERLANLGLVDLEYSATAYSEACVGRGIREAKAELYTWAGLANQPEFEDSWRAKIAIAAFPNGIESKSQRNDVEILLTAKLAGAILVTTDGGSKAQPRGILGSRRELAALGITVASPVEAVTLATCKRQPE